MALEQTHKIARLQAGEFGCKWLDHTNINADIGGEGEAQFVEYPLTD